MASKERVLTGASQVKPVSQARPAHQVKPQKLRKGLLERGLFEGLVKRIRRAGRFLREVRAELRKVTWPSRKELFTYTIVVIVSVLAVAGFIGLIDLVFSQFLRLIMKS